MTSPVAWLPVSLGNAVSVVLLSLILIWLYRTWNPRKSSLPGPAGWPLLGFTEYIFTKAPTKLLLKLKDKYGNIFGFQLGCHYCVVLSDFASMKEAYGKKELLGRPPKFLRTSVEYQNLLELKLPDWEIQRKFLTDSLKYLGIGRARFEDIVHDELSRVIPRLEQHVGRSECNIEECITSSINNIVFQVICSRWFEDDHHVMKSFRRFQELGLDYLSNNTAFLYFPFLDRLLVKFHPHYQEIVKSCSAVSQFLRSEIKKRQKVHNENSTHDYIDLYLSEMKRRNHDPDLFNVEQLAENCTILLIAGSDTTRFTLEWLLLTVAEYQSVQDKVHSEIMSVIGSEKLPVFADKAQLPYTEATILESARWKTLVNQNLLRRASEDCTVNGSLIPKGSVVIGNLYNCHMDPDLWDTPETFSPDRFLTKDKTRAVIPEYFMPFSLGKRKCPGDKMAAIEIFIYFTRIVQKFRILPPEGGVSFRATDKINYVPVRPVVKLELR